MATILVEKAGVRRTALFAFIPKTGGTALVRFLKSIGCEIFLDYENNRVADVFKCPTQHFHYDILDKIYRLEKFDFTFSVVRYPIDRCKSDYLYAFRRATDLSQLPSFDRWISKMMEWYKNDPFVFDNHFRPQSDFIGPGIQKVYRYEDGLEAAVLDIVKNLGLGLKLDSESRFIPRANTAADHFGNETRSADVVVTERARAMLMEFYQTDFENFYPNVLTPN